MGIYCESVRPGSTIPFVAVTACLLLSLCLLLVVVVPVPVVVVGTFAVTVIVVVIVDAAAVGVAALFVSVTCVLHRSLLCFLAPKPIIRTNFHGFASTNFPLSRTIQYSVDT